METIFLFFGVIYGIFALLHLILQILFSVLNARKQRSRSFKNQHSGYISSVSVVVPVYNENPQLLKACIDSILAQVGANEFPVSTDSTSDQDFDQLPERLKVAYAENPELVSAYYNRLKAQLTDYALECIVIDDGSKNIADLEQQVYSQYSDNPLVKIVRADKNQGKRHQQKRAFDMAKGDIIITVDSDTILHEKGAIRKMIAYFEDTKIGAVSGYVSVENRKKNWLTRLIGYRYWNAFYQERAAQSYWVTVMCCTGPFSAYRKSIIDQVKADYVSETFLGETCTFGDDRHLTNLVLAQGHQVLFNELTEASTAVPETISQYIKQQIRWNKSFYREMIWTFRHVKKDRFYLYYELLSQAFLPFLLTISLIFMLIESIALDHPQILLVYLMMLFGIALIRALYGLIRTRDIGFLSFIFYGLLHVLILLPVRYYALATIRQGKWGTR